MEGQLYRIWESNNGCNSSLQLILPYSYRLRVIEKAHQSSKKKHASVKQTIETLQEKYNFHKMRDFVRRWLRSCKTCRREKEDRGETDSNITR